MRIIRGDEEGTAGLVTELAAAGLVIEVLMFEIVVGDQKKWKETVAAAQE
jgi:hypothetical protein